MPPGVIPGRQGGAVVRHLLRLESSLPGVFAVGDVRSGSITRVAAAVSKGAMAVALVHEYLQEAQG